MKSRQAIQSQQNFQDTTEFTSQLGRLKVCLRFAINVEISFDAWTWYLCHIIGGPEIGEFYVK